PLAVSRQLRSLRARLRPGQRVLVGGRGEPALGMAPPRLVHPDVAVLGEDEQAPPAIVPVYEKPTAMPVGVMRRIVQGAVDAFADRVPAPISPDVARRHPPVH